MRRAPWKQGECVLISATTVGTATHRMYTPRCCAVLTRIPFGSAFYLLGSALERARGFHLGLGHLASRLLHATATAQLTRASGVAWLPQVPHVLPDSAPGGNPGGLLVLPALRGGGQARHRHRLQAGPGAPLRPLPTDVYRALPSQRFRARPPPYITASPFFRDEGGPAERPMKKRGVRVVSERGD